jgi:hypothetical protein
LARVKFVAIDGTSLHTPPLPPNAADLRCTRFSCEAADDAPPSLADHIKAPLPTGMGDAVVVVIDVCSDPASEARRATMRTNVDVGPLKRVMVGEQLSLFGKLSLSL